MFADRLDSTVQQAMAQRDKDRAVFLKSFLSLVLKYDHIVVFHHVRPDGDSLGSAFGFQEIIRANFPHKKVYVVGDNFGAFPWLQMRFDNFLNYGFDFSNALAVIFDVGQSARIQKFNRFFKNSKVRFGNVVRVDHHGIPADFHVDLTWDDLTYAATCAQIMQIADFYSWKVTPKAATFLYLGICTDSLRFSTESSLPRTLILAAKTWRNGADYANVHRCLYKRTWNDIKSQIYLLNNCSRTDNVVWFFLTKEKMEELQISNTSSLVSVFANIEGHWIWILFSENDEGKVNVNMRSVHVGIRDLAIKYGGGGHEFASGTVIEKNQIQNLVDDANEIVERAKKDNFVLDVIKFDDFVELENEKQALSSIKESKELIKEAQEILGGLQEEDSENEEGSTQ